MNDVPLHADCGRCAALCCICLDFDRSEFFAFDKPAGVACSNLNANHQCHIHPDLIERGFSGCVHFDCLGAGQHVTQEVFAGRSWKDDPGLLQPMSDAFRVMRRVHELLALLQTADRLPLTPEQTKRQKELKAALQPTEGWSFSALMKFERGNTTEGVENFLSTLREHVPVPG